MNFDFTERLNAATNELMWLDFANGLLDELVAFSAGQKKYEVTVCEWDNAIVIWVEIGEELRTYPIYQRFYGNADHLERKGWHLSGAKAYYKHKKLSAAKAFGVTSAVSLISRILAAE